MIADQQPWAGDEVCLGVDGGQTATRAAAVLTGGTVIATVEAPGLLHPMSPEGVKRLRAVLGEIHRALSGRRVRSAYLALTGVEGPESPSHGVALSVAQGIWPDTLVTVDNDGMAAWAGGTTGQPGVAAMAGTGSVVIAINEAGTRVRTGGWGPLLGDAGGGWRIGLAAVAMMLRRWDAGQEPSELDRSVLSELGLSSPGEAPPAIAGGCIDRLAVVRLASMVGARAADIGDAAQILEQAASALAEDVAAAMSRLEWRDLPVTVVPVGNVFRAGSAYLCPFERALTIRAATPFVLRSPTLSAVGGAVFLARRQAGLPTEEAALRSMASDLAYKEGGA